MRQQTHSTDERAVLIAVDRRAETMLYLHGWLR
jgi:hypothetical protein